MQWLNARVAVAQTRAGDERPDGEARHDPLPEPADGQRMPGAQLSSWRGVAEAGRPGGDDPAPEGRRPLRLRYADRI